MICLLFQPYPMNFNKFIKFFTTGVFWFLFIGVLLIIVGATNTLNYLLPNIIPPNSPVQVVVKTVGATFVGSGVFTAIIKSSEYSEIFSNVIGEIIWSRKYIEKRTDKKDIWRMVSRLTYEEKFPLISEEIEDIITNHYFPVKHNFYVENYQYCLNIVDCDHEEYWKHEEVVSLTIKPINAKEKIEYIFKSAIDLPDNISDENPDRTSFEVISILVNGREKGIPIPAMAKDSKLFSHRYSIDLQHEDQYDLVIQRNKLLSKKKNPDKRNFAPYIIKDAEVRVILKKEMEVDFHKMGTINDFMGGSSHINGDIKIVNWTYKGLILPQQGFVMIFK